MLNDKKIFSSVLVIYYYYMYVQGLLQKKCK